MPKIEITEKIIESSPVYSYDSNVIYIPTFDNGGTTSTDIKVYYSTVSYAADSGKDVYIKKVLESGLPVATNTFKTVDDMKSFLGGTEKNDVTKCPLADRNLWNIRILTLGNFDRGTNDSDSTLVNLLISLAEYRGDCFALIDCKPEDATVDALKASFANVTHSKYAAGCGPYIKFKGDETFYPASLGYLIAYGNSLLTNPTWYAPAGATRGQISGIEAVKAEFGELAIDELEPLVSNEMGLNLVCRVEPYGIVFWGNRTLYEGTNSTSLEYGNILSIRSLLCTLKKIIHGACLNCTFEQNTDILWVNFKSLVTPTLDKMLSGNGIAGYKLLKVQTTKLATLECTLKIIPIEPVENFEVTIELSNSIDTTTEA